MLSRLIDSVVSGEPTAWGLLGLLWSLTAVAAALQRSPRGPGAYARVFSLLALAMASAAVGLAATHALSIPRLTWRPSVEPAIVRPVGTSWRVLRGPPVPVTVDGLPDIGVPALDPEGRWVLYGLLSGEPVPGLRAAEPGPREGGALRICDDQDDCRPWPADWPPTNAVAATMELRFAAAAPLASLAYDVEYRRYLVDDGVSVPTLELEGRFTNGPSKAGPRALFVLRRLASDRFEGLRVVATADEREATFRLDRAHANLTAASWARRWIADPLLFASLLMLPAMGIGLLLAPRWLRASLKRRSASPRDAGLPVMIVPEPRDRTDRGLAVLATEAALGDATLPPGTVVRIGFAAAGARSVVSQRWLELPPAADEPPLLEGVRPVGTLIPADPAPFARAARLWLLPTAHVAAVLACGLSIVAPALVAVTSLLATR